MTAPNPCKLQHFFALIEPFFFLDERQKKAGIYAVFKNRKTIVFMRVLASWHCLCSIFKRAMLSHVPQETTLQIETGPQRDPKESWREETHRSFYTHTGAFTQRSLYTKELLIYIQKVFTQRSLYSKELLHTNEMELLHTDALTHMT